jgi:hypothetical protein
MTTYHQHLQRARQLVPKQEEKTFNETKASRQETKNKPPWKSLALEVPPAPPPGDPATPGPAPVSTQKKKKTQINLKTQIAHAETKKTNHYGLQIHHPTRLEQKTDQQQMSLNAVEMPKKKESQTLSPGETWIVALRNAPVKREKTQREMLIKAIELPEEISNEQTTPACSSSRRDIANTASSSTPPIEHANIPKGR